MRYMLFWRVAGTVIGLTWAAVAFRFGLTGGSKLKLLMDCLCAAVFFHGAMESHSGVKHLRQRRNGH